MKKKLFEGNEIKNLIQMKLISEGVVSTSTVINKEYIERIVYKKTEEYLNKNKEVIDEVVDDITNDDVTKDEKCGKPKIVQSLPHDLRTNKTNELQERFDEMNNRINSLEKDLESCDKDMEMDLDLAEHWTRDRKKFKKFIDNFEKEDKARLNEKLKIVEDIKKSWDNIKEEYDINNEGSDAWSFNVFMEHDIDGLFTRSFTPGVYSNESINAISVLQSDSIDLTNLIKQSDGRYDLYFGYNANTFGNGLKEKVRNEIRWFASKLPKKGKSKEMNGIIDNLKKLIESPRKVQNDAKKYVIMKDVYPNIEKWYQKEGGESVAIKTNKAWDKHQKIYKELFALYDERYALLEKLEN